MQNSKLTRRQVDKGLLERLAPKLEEKGFLLIKDLWEDKKYQRYYFKKRVNEFDYILSIHTSNKGGYEFYTRVDVYSELINNIFRRLDSKYIEDLENQITIASVNLAAFVAPDTNVYKYNWEEIKVIHREENFTEQKLDYYAEQIYNIYFIPLVENFIPETDNYFKLEKLYNNAPNVDDYSKEIVCIRYTGVLFEQFIVGLVLAKIVKNPKFDELANRYLYEYKDYSIGELEGADLLRKAVFLIKDGQVKI